MKRAYADIPEGQIHYRIEGEGEYIIMLHMAVSSSDEYTRVIHLLSKKYCAVAMDYLGQEIQTRLRINIRYWNMPER